MTVALTQACQEDVKLQNAEVTDLIWVENPKVNHAISDSRVTPCLIVCIRLNSNGEMFDIPVKDVRSIVEVNFRGNSKDTKGNFEASCDGLNIEFKLPKIIFKENASMDFVYTLNNVTPNDTGVLEIEYFTQKKSIELSDLVDKVGAVSRNSLGDVVNDFIDSCEQNDENEVN